jgi:thioredoxin-like negative regulator of GroEL
MSIPTLMVVEDGQIISKAMGTRPKDAILAML